MEHGQFGAGQVDDLRCGHGGGGEATGSRRRQGQRPQLGVIQVHGVAAQHGGDDVAGADVRLLAKMDRQVRGDAILGAEDALLVALLHVAEVGEA